MVRAEVCVGGREDALAAEAGGADRIELCAGLVVGGLTPSLGTVATVLADVGIPTVVLVRPREGDFCYTSAEMEVLLRDVRFLREAGVHGIATGVLRRNGTVDRDAMERIQDAAGSMAITFHRAFDMTRDPWESLAVLMELGIPRLLTSGLESGVVEGTPLIRGLVESAGGALSVMPGGGVRPENVETLIRETGVSEVHFTAFSTSESPMTHRNLRPRMGGGRVPGEFERTVTDPERVKLFLEKIRGGGKPPDSRPLLRTEDISRALPALATEAGPRHGLPCPPRLLSPGIGSRREGRESKPPPAPGPEETKDREAEDRFSVIQKEAEQKRLDADRHGNKKPSPIPGSASYVSRYRSVVNLPAFPSSPRSPSCTIGRRRGGTADRAPERVREQGAVPCRFCGPTVVPGTSLVAGRNGLQGMCLPLRPEREAGFFNPHRLHDGESGIYLISFHEFTEINAPESGGGMADASLRGDNAAKSSLLHGCNHSSRGTSGGQSPTERSERGIRDSFSPLRFASTREPCRPGKPPHLDRWKGRSRGRG